MPRTKPPSEKQLAANRRNAQSSTGPRTPEGKARSRWNALKHGVLSKSLIPEPLAEQESRRDYSRLLDALREDLGCATALEEMLVERIAACYWRLGRLTRAEAGAVAQRRLKARDWNADLRASRRSRGELSLAEQLVEAIGNALGDIDRLRSIMTALDPAHSSLPADELRSCAELARREYEIDIMNDHLLRDRIDDDVASIPRLDDAHSFARYETHLERRLYRALEELERLQRHRLRQAPGAPLDLNADDDGDAAGA